MAYRRGHGLGAVVNPQILELLGRPSHPRRRRGFGACDSTGNCTPAVINGVPTVTQYQYYTDTIDLAAVRARQLSGYAVVITDPAGQRPDLVIGPTDNALAMLANAGVTTLGSGVSETYNQIFLANSALWSDPNAQAKILAQMAAQGWTPQELATLTAPAPTTPSEVVQLQPVQHPLTAQGGPSYDPSAYWGSQPAASQVMAPQAIQPTTQAGQAIINSSGATQPQAVPSGGSSAASLSVGGFDPGAYVSQFAPAGMSASAYSMIGWGLIAAAGLFFFGGSRGR